MVDHKEIEMSLCWIVLPTYCEAENLPGMIEGIDQHVNGINILVVDDNSQDGTAAVAAEIAERRPGLHVLRRPAKTGLGDAYIEGFRFVIARGAQFVVTMDGDLSHLPETIPAMFAAIGPSGCVVGSRYVAGGRIEKWSRGRRLLSWTANRFVSLLFRMPVSDCTSAFRLYRRDVIESILSRSPISQGYSFQVEALTIATRGRSGTVEVPIRFVERVSGESKMGYHEVLGGARSLLALRFGRGGHPAASQVSSTNDTERLDAGTA